ncbi:thio(seleno)oxazole modification radical SAM maturase SbtM [Desulfomicrobium baculatum]|uniref:Radical SAM domain protein n=1 Tax=Desulfomicrobium baculatum (strain DSM 4028 / VKM B-1378 / X) TaxID=525897 RepID=C7LNM1_DESBD|nr:thio(seleno)oxazole modification radical SAM maturase SbtM [Desulfomicrobium baculatum]ACU88906.1 Radical SAM domain protein [Desulfomicrobium baculatum DSM 4028]
MNQAALHTLYPVTASFLDAETLSNLEAAHSKSAGTLLTAIAEISREGLAPFFLPDICALELAMEKVASKTVDQPGPADGIIVNPSLELCVLHTSGCVDVIHGLSTERCPVHGQEMIMVWKNRGMQKVTVAVAKPEDLAAIKIITDGVDPSSAETEANVTPGLVDILLGKAVDKGILLSPASLIRRKRQDFSDSLSIPEEHLSAEVFTLQWHITQDCDLFCRHCYDRSARANMAVDKALDVIDDFHSFCRDRHVRGQISFSGGNPLLYPGFLEVYERAARKGFAVAILGNPTTRETMDSILKIARPEYFQVSLEGLPAHNDSIRGHGHFQRVMNFLEILRAVHVQGQIMLTLTRDNMNQVLPLAELLEVKVWGLAFNRLSPVGRGAALALPSPAEFQDFAARYCESASRLSVLSFKDNMLNAHLAATGQPLFGGCTGFGCGAAFNFMALLPDGEVHACRKFPSLIGNIAAASLGEIYDGQAAVSYRTRSEACRECAIVATCGGCPAVVSGLGLDIAKDRDPFCPGPILLPQSPATPAS